jgi:hypothetical protein
MNQETSSDNASSSAVPVAENQPAQPATWRKMLRRLVALVVAGLCLVVIGLPTIVATTGLHNAILDKAAEGRELSVSAESVTLGWLAPVTLSGADVKRDDRSWEFTTQKFSTDKTLLQLLLAPSAIGTIYLDSPIVVVQPINRELAGEDDEEEGSKSRLIYPEFRTVVRDGAVQVRGANSPDPVIEIDGISFTGWTRVRNESSMLIVDPVKLFDRRELTPELCDQGLQLIAPILSDSATVSGQLSIELDDFQIPIGTVTQEERIEFTKISGRMMLHRVETGLKNPILTAITSVLATLSGGHFGTVQAAEDTEVTFRVEGGRVYHEGLTFLVPELASDLMIQTSGWVDLEENIDVQILVNITALASSRIEILSSLMQAPLEIRMTGTLKKPRISLPAGRNMLDQLAGRFGELTGLDDAPGGPGKPNLPDVISDLVGSLVRESEGKLDVQNTARGIFDLIGTLRDKSGSADRDKAGKR